MRQLLSLLFLFPALAWPHSGLEQELQLRLKLGEFGEPACASILNLRPVEQGFDDIRFEAIPGAHRVVVVPSSSGWRMAQGVPELTVFTAAGYYTMEETTYTSPEGEKRPAREYRLTQKGYFAAQPQRPHCYDFVSYSKVELAALKETPVPERLKGLGKAYRAALRLHHSELLPWARSPEFRYVFTKVSNVAQNAGGPVQREQLYFFHDRRWMSERETMMALMVDAATLRAPAGVDQQAAQARLAELAPAHRAAKLAALDEKTLRARLAKDPQQGKFSPCLELPTHQADLTGGLWKKDMAPTFVLFEQADRRDRTRFDHAQDFLQRLEKAGLAKSEAFDGEPFPRAKAGKGTRYVLSEDAAAALGAPRPTCLPLGEGEMREVQIGKPGMNGTAFRAWAQLAQPRPWTAALAAQFPNVRALLEHGYGISGTVPVQEDVYVQVQLQVPAFARKPLARPVRLEPLVAPEGPAVVDQAPGTPVQMLGPGCTVSADGTEVTGTGRSCNQARASRGFRAGKAYAEISFRGKADGAHPDTWTNAALTSKRSLYSLSTGAALFSFAGSFNKHRIRHGDVISLALDMDERVLYWRLNGEWMTGRPGTGLGEPMLFPNEEYFIAVSLQDPAEAWRVNFGATPFRHPVPEGYPAYGAPR